VSEHSAIEVEPDMNKETEMFYNRENTSY